MNNQPPSIGKQFFLYLSISLRCITSLPGRYDLNLINYDRIGGDYSASIHQLNGPSPTFIFRNWKAYKTEIVPLNLLSKYQQKIDFDLLATVGQKQVNGKTEYYVKIPTHRPLRTLSGSSDYRHFNTRKYILVQMNSQNHLEYETGQSLRFGNLGMRILEMRGWKAQNGQIAKNQVNYLEKIGEQIFEAVEKVRIDCRICLSSEDRHQMIVPCKCRGNIGSVHVGCLKQWMTSKVKINKRTNVTAWCLDKQTCQICKDNLPLLMKVNNSLHELIEIQRPDHSYMLVEVVYPNQLNNKSKIKCFALFKFQTKSELNFGTNLNCDLPIEDLDSTVNQYHAQFTFSNGKFYLKDLSSKFGTFVEAEGEIPLKGLMWIEAGMNLYEFSLN